MSSHCICYGTPVVNRRLLCPGVAAETVPVPQEAGRREVSCFEEGLRTFFLQSGNRCLGRKWRRQLPASPTPGQCADPRSQGLPQPFWLDPFWPRRYVGCRVKDLWWKVLGLRLMLEQDQNKSKSREERGVWLPPMCASHPAHYTQYMALIKTRRVVNCCGSKQCPEAAIVIVAITFSLVDDSLPSEIACTGGVTCTVLSNAGNQSTFLQLGGGFFPLSQMKFSNSVC